MRHVCGVLLLAVMCGLSALAQTSGRISGTVVDPTGASVPAADVSLFLTGGQRPLLTTKTADDGQFNFIGVRPADYDVVIAASGFMKITLRKIAVDPARETSLPQVKLETATVTYTVDVASGLDVVSTSNAEIAQTITADQVKNLPTARSRRAWPGADAAWGRVQRKLIHRDQRLAHLLLQHDAGWCQRSGQLHSRQRAGLFSQQTPYGTGSRNYPGNGQSEYGRLWRRYAVRHVVTFRDQ